jgi:hypothetical protein
MHTKHACSSLTFTQEGQRCRAAPHNACGRAERSIGIPGRGHGGCGRCPFASVARLAGQNFFASSSPVGCAVSSTQACSRGQWWLASSLAGTSITGGRGRLGAGGHSCWEGAAGAAASAARGRRFCHNVQSRRWPISLLHAILRSLLATRIAIKSCKGARSGSPALLVSLGGACVIRPLSEQQSARMLPIHTQGGAFVGPRV